MTENEVKAVFYTYLTTNTIEFALIETHKHITKDMLDLLLPSFGLNTETNQTLHNLYIARANIHYFQIGPKGNIMIQFNDMHDYEYLIHLYQSLADGFMYLHDYYLKLPIKQFKSLYTKDQILNMSASYSGFIEQTKDRQRKKENLLMPASILTIARDLIDTIILAMIGEINFKKLVIEYDGNLKHLETLRGEFSLNTG